MLVLPSGVPVQWELQPDGYFRRQSVFPKNTSRGEIEYSLWMGHQHGHDLCDSVVDGAGPQRLGGKRKYQFDLMIRSRQEVHSFLGCWWYVYHTKFSYPKG